MIEIIKWEEAAPRVLVHASGCEWPMARLMLIEAAREFFARSCTWVIDCNPLLTMTGIPDYDMLDVRGVDVVRLQQAFVNGQQLEAQGIDEFTRVRQSNAGAMTGQPEAAVFRDGLVEFFPTPGATGQTIMVSFVVKPEIAAIGLPSPQWEAHMDAIIDGALSKLLLSPGKPYADPTSGRRHEERFLDAITTAAWMADTAQGTKVRRTTPFPLGYW